MNIYRPGIFLARSGLHFAIDRLIKAEENHSSKPTSSTEAYIIRSACETLFWLFALNEDFKKLIETETTQTIHEWWNSQNIVGRNMNGLRLIRNRVTHSYEYYWNIWDLDNLTWSAIESPTQEELESNVGRFVEEQFLDYQETILGEKISSPLLSVAKTIKDEHMKHDIVKW